MDEHMNKKNGLAEYFPVVCRETAWKERNLSYYLSQLLRGVDFSGKTILEIGAGEGVFSLYMVCSGARKAIALEPEAAGAASGVQLRFSRMREQLSLGDVQMLPIIFQKFDPGKDKFDLVLLHNSINHLDEQACINLHRDREAWSIYLHLFQRLSGLMNPGGTLIMADCSRHNFFGWLGITNPIARSIEWHKHQPPALWIKLASEAGFINPAIAWKSFSPLGTMGRIFLANKLAAFFLMSHFRISMEKPC
jgi:SAM-dependent methyltransferase